MKILYRILCAITIIGFVFGCHSRQDRSDLKNEPNSVLSDSLVRLDSLVKLMKGRDRQVALRYAYMGLAIASRIHTEQAFATAYLALGAAHTYSRKDSSFFYNSKALKIADKLNLVHIKSAVLYNLAVLHYFASDYKMALVYFDSVIYLANQIGDYHIISDTYNGLGNLQFDLSDNDASKRMYDSALSVAKRHKLSKQTGVAIASLSRFETDPFVSGIMMKQAIEFLSQKPGREDEIAQVLTNLGMNSLDPDTAIGYYIAAIGMADNLKLLEVQIAASNNLAYSYLDKREYLKADSCISKYAIPLAEKNENFDWLATLYDTYADVLLAQNKKDKAFENARKALNARKTADKQLAADQVRLLAALLDVKNKELNLEIKAQELKDKENSTRRIVFWFSLLIMILGVIIFLVILKGQRNKIKFQVELIGSAKKLIDLEEVMKGRVAMELHDLTTPFYFTMLQQIENAKIMDSGIADDMKSKVSAMAKNIRDISHRMNNDFIGQMTIQELVKGLCDNLKEASTVPLHCVIDPGNFNLTKEETIHIYRIIQELLINALKHVHSGEINLSLTMEEGMVFILYQDSGTGFDVSTSGLNGLGLLNIFERAKIINGTAVLNSKPAEGTRWNISIPHKQEVKENPESSKS